MLLATAVDLSCRRTHNSTGSTRRTHSGANISANFVENLSILSSTCPACANFLLPRFLEEAGPPTHARVFPTGRTVRGPSSRVADGECNVPTDRTQQKSRKVRRGSVQRGVQVAQRHSAPHSHARAYASLTRIGQGKGSRAYPLLHFGLSDASRTWSEDGVRV